jgi:hypothetical protein
LAFRTGPTDVVPESDMLDILYIAITIAFFGLMLAFIRGLEILGRDAAIEEREP